MPRSSPHPPPLAAHAAGLAGLLHRDVRGRSPVCRNGATPLAGARQWLGLYEKFWTDRLAVLEQLLRNDKPR